MEALDYVCRQGGRGQVAVWLDTDEDVRRFVRLTLYEEDGKEDEAPLAPLPQPLPSEAAVITRWRRAREDAMELWAGEMSVDGGSEGGEEGEEEDCEEDPEEDSDAGGSSDDMGDDMGNAEERRGFS